MYNWRKPCQWYVRRQQSRDPNYDRFPRKNDTRTRMRQFTHTRECEMDNAVRLYDDTRTRVTGRVRRFANKSESVVLAPEFSDEGDSRKGRGAASEPRCWREEEEEEEKAEEAESIVPFLAPFSTFPRAFFFCPLSLPAFHTGAPCGTFYLPKATSNAPARAQVCAIVSRPTYRVLPSLLCVWPL